MKLAEVTDPSRGWYECCFECLSSFSHRFCDDVTDSTLWEIYSNTILLEFLLLNSLYVIHGNLMVEQKGQEFIHRFCVMFAIAHAQSSKTTWPK